MKKGGLNFLFFIAVLVLISACDDNRVFDEYKAIPETGWNKDSLLVFEIPVTDTTQNHDLYINIRNDIKYKYSNLWLFVEIAEPGGAAHTDTFEVTLADPSGKWLGTGFSGIKTREVVYKRNVYFPVSGLYKINIQHGMRDVVLQGITDVGLRVEN